MKKTLLLALVLLSLTMNALADELETSSISDEQTLEVEDLPSVSPASIDDEGIGSDDTDVPTDESDEDE